MSPVLSVVVPLRDEALNVEPLYHEITRALAALPFEYEVILIDDGSVDETFANLTSIQSRDIRSSPRDPRATSAWTAPRMPVV